MTETHSSLESLSTDDFLEFFDNIREKIFLREVEKILSKYHVVFIPESTHGLEFKQLLKKYSAVKFGGYLRKIFDTYRRKALSEDAYDKFLVDHRLCNSLLHIDDHSGEWCYTINYVCYYVPSESGFDDYLELDRSYWNIFISKEATNSPRAKFVKKPT